MYNYKMQRYIVRENWGRRRVVNYSGGICTFVFLVVILTLFLGNPLLWWLWFFVLFPVGGWGYGYVRPVKIVTTYNPLNEPRSPQEGSEPSGVSIEMTELKF